MRKPLLAFSLILLLASTHLTHTAPMGKTLRTQLNPHYVRAMAAYRKLETKLPRDELRAITTIGVMNGAKTAEQQMEKQLVEEVKDLVLNTDVNDKEKTVPKIVKIEKMLERDRKALEILTSAMDIVTKRKNVREFQQEIREQSTVKGTDNQGVGADGTASEKDKSEGQDIPLRIGSLRQQILKQVNAMKTRLEEKIDDTLEYLVDEADEQSLLAKASHKAVQKREVGQWPENRAEIRMLKSILTEVSDGEAEGKGRRERRSLRGEFMPYSPQDDFRHNLVLDSGRGKRQEEFNSLEDEANDSDGDGLSLEGKTKKVINSSSSSSGSISTMVTETLAAQVNTSTDASESSRPAKQEDSSPEITDGNDNGGGGGGGGLVGIISSLSGGEGGSDIGALIGALTGLISTLFGPNGLDIETLISTATALISGLLAGNKNFGTVLGEYVGTAFDGLSGGGGAVNNGQFVGNFLGTVVASLSADPEDDDEPPKPLLFAQNLISSFLEAKNRKASEEVSAERKDHSAAAGTGKTGGSDSGAFIKHIVSHLVGGAVSLILNASLGASGGASHASGGLFHGSSAASHKPVKAHAVTGGVGAHYIKG